MDRGVVRIDVRTETDRARELLSERAGELRSALEQHGVRVERFEVTADLPREWEGDAANDGAGLAGGGAVLRCPARRRPCS